jgi:ABC-2 type transport system permease protein
MDRLRAILFKEFRQILRDRLSLAMLVLVPALLLVLYGYALSFDVRHVKTAVLDEDQTPASRQLLDGLFQNPYFTRCATLTRRGDADAWLANGKARVVLVIPRGFSEVVKRSEEATVQALVDGAEATAASVVVGYLDLLAARFTSAAGGGAGGARVVLEPRVWFNPDLNSAHFLVPGLIGYVLMIASVIATSLSLVREKERKTIEQINVSAVRPIELILGKTLPYVLVCLITVGVVLVLGYFLFGVAVRGSFLLLSISTLCFLFAALGLGLLISSITHSQQEAFQIAMLVSLLPSITLSGLIFPIRSMPLPLQWLTHLVIPRYFIEILRGIILKDSPLADLLWPLGGMLALGVLFSGLAARNMRKVQ